MLAAVLEVLVQGPKCRRECDDERDDADDARRGEGHDEG